MADEHGMAVFFPGRREAARCRPRIPGSRASYPVGVGDLAELTGRPFDPAALRRVPMFLFQGADDDNDSVPEGDLRQDSFGSDSYDFAQSVWINETFGALPVERVPRVRGIYESLPMTDFAYRVYPGVRHRVTDAQEADVRAFFDCVLDGRSACAQDRTVAN